MIYNILYIIYHALNEMSLLNKNTSKSTPNTIIDKLAKLCEAIISDRAVKKKQGMAGDIKKVQKKNIYRTTKRLKLKNRVR